MDESITQSLKNIKMRKWFILIAYSFLVFMNGYAFSSISSIPEKAEEYFNQPIAIMSLFVISFYVIYIPIAPFATWLLRTDLHKSLLLSFFLSILGAWIKVIAGPNFWLSLMGQVVLSSVTSIILSAISTIADAWFTKTQQLLAIAIGESMTFLGIGISYIIAGEISISKNNTIQATFITIIAIMYLFIGKKAPKSAKKTSLKSCFWELKNLDFCHASLILIMGAYTGLAYSFLGVIGAALSGKGISSKEVSFIGFLISFLGFVGGIFASFVQRYNKSLLFISLGCALCLGVWACADKWVIANYVLGGLTGFFYFGIIPLGYRTALHFNKRVSESIVSGLIFLSAQIFGLLFTYPLLYSSQIGMGSISTFLVLFAIISPIHLLLSIRISRMNICLDQKLIPNSKYTV